MSIINPCISIQEALANLNRDFILKVSRISQPGAAAVKVCDSNINRVYLRLACSSSASTVTAYFDGENSNTATQILPAALFEHVRIIDQHPLAVSQGYWLQSSIGGVFHIVHEVLFRG